MKERKSWTIRAEVPIRMIEDTLVSAFEGGSSYWADIHISRKGMSYLDLVKSKMVTIFDLEADPKREKKYVLTIADLKKSLQVMANAYPHYFYDLVTEEGDSTTGDVFLQCAIFGKIVYG